MSDILEIPVEIKIECTCGQQLTGQATLSPDYSHGPQPLVIVRPCPRCTGARENTDRVVMNLTRTDQAALHRLMRDAVVQDGTPAAHIRAAILYRIEKLWRQLGRGRPPMGE